MQAAGADAGIQVPWRFLLGLREDLHGVWGAGTAVREGMRETVPLRP